MTSIVLRGATLSDAPDATAVDILVRDGRIAGVDTAHCLDGDAIVDVAGAWLLPGLVDAHVHPIHAESFSSVGEQSVLGGITTVLNHLYPEPGEPFADAVRRACLGGAHGGADFGFHVRITPDRIDRGVDRADLDLSALSCLAGVVSTKVFLAHSDRAVTCSPGDLVTVMIASRDAGLPLIVHAELGEIISSLERQLGRPTNLREHDALRSEQLEAAAVVTVGAVARTLDARAYIAHISSPLVVHALLAARRQGAQLLGETCPHYLCLDRDLAPDVLGRVAPPLRSAEAVAHLRAEVAAGHLDVLASDHCGYDAVEKPIDSFPDAGNGLPGLDSMLALLLDAATTGEWLCLDRLIELVCSGPARAFGLTDKGRIEQGAEADLVVVDPGGTTTPRAHPPGPATARSPYEGRVLRGSVIHVLRRGEFAVRDGRPTGLDGGQPVRRGKSSW